MNWEGLKRDLRFYVSRKIDYPVVVPSNLTLNLTYRCNQSCIMCSIKKDMDPAVELALAEVKDIIDQMALWGIPEIVFTGGEPLILKDIFQMIEYASHKRVRPTLITNCFCPKDTLERLKASSIGHIQVSVDGADAQTHDTIRKAKGSFAVTIANLEELVSVPNRRFSINATTTIVNQNVGQLSDIALLMKKTGVERLSIRPVHKDNADPAKAGGSESPCWIPAGRLHILNSQIDELQEYHRRTGFIDCRPGFDYLKEYYKNGHIKATNSCFNGYNRVIIAYNERGSYEVWMCAGMIGDIRKNSLRALWVSRKAKTLRRAMKRCANSCALPCCYEAGLESLSSIIRKNRST